MCKFEVRGTLFPRVPGGEPGKHRAMALSVVAKCVRAETFKKEKALANLARHKKGGRGKQKAVQANHRLSDETQRQGLHL